MYSVHKYKTAVRNTAVPDCRKSLFLKQTSNLLSLSPCPLSPGKGDFTGATAPSPCRGLRPCDPIFNKQEVYRQSVFPKKCLFSIPIRTLCGLCVLQSLAAYTPDIRAGAECGAAALTKQGCLQSVTQSHYARTHNDSHTKPLHDATAQMAVNAQMQRHQRLTTRIGATPQTPFSKI